MVQPGLSQRHGRAPESSPLLQRGPAETQTALPKRPLPFPFLWRLGDADCSASSPRSLPFSGSEEPACSQSDYYLAFRPAPNVRIRSCPYGYTVHIYTDTHTVSSRQIATRPCKVQGFATNKHPSPFLIPPKKRKTTPPLAARSTPFRIRTTSCNCQVTETAVHAAVSPAIAVAVAVLRSYTNSPGAGRAAPGRPSAGKRSPGVRRNTAVREVRLG